MMVDGVVPGKVTYCELGGPRAPPAAAAGGASEPPLVWARDHESGTLCPMPLEKLERCIEVERRRIRFLVKMPTGAGKTLTALSTMCHTLGPGGMTKDRPVVVVVPTMVLARQFELAIARFTRLSSVIISDKKFQEDPSQDLYHWIKRSVDSRQALRKLAEHRRVIVLVGGLVCNQVLAAARNVFFLIMDEIQDLVDRPGEGYIRQHKKKKPLAYMNRLLLSYKNTKDSVSSEHMLLLSATPEAVLDSVERLLMPAELYQHWSTRRALTAFRERHTCNQYVPPRRVCAWTYQTIVTAPTARGLYERLASAQPNFVAKPKAHSDANLRLISVLLHRLSQRPSSTLRENLEILVMQLLQKDISKTSSSSGADRGGRGRRGTVPADVPANGGLEIHEWLDHNDSSHPLPKSTVPAHPSSTEDPGCPVCFETLTAGTAVQLTCRHLVCRSCLLTWCTLRPAAPHLCPLDNQPIWHVAACGGGSSALLSGGGDVPVDDVVPVLQAHEVRAGAEDMLRRLACPGPTPTLCGEEKDRGTVEGGGPDDAGGDDGDDTGDDEDAGLPSPSLLPAPFSQLSKVDALLATLRSHQGQRSLLFCCPEELGIYARAVERGLGLRTTRSVRAFKDDADIAMILLPHSEAAGANLAEASLLIRISISTDDPAQTKQQRGRLTRHTQVQDLTEVVIVSPGWEYMLLQLQRTNEVRFHAQPTERYSPATPRTLCMTMFHMLQFGDRLGFRPDRPGASSGHDVHHLVSLAGLKLYPYNPADPANLSSSEAVSVEFLPPGSVYIIRHKPFIVAILDLRTGTVRRAGQWTKPRKYSDLFEVARAACTCCLHQCANTTTITTAPSSIGGDIPSKLCPAFRDKFRELLFCCPEDAPNAPLPLLKDGPDVPPGMDFFGLDD